MVRSASQPDTEILPGDPPVPVRLRPDPRARRFSLRVSQGCGRVTLTFPPRAGRAAALAFARDREDWLRRTLAGLPDRQVAQPGVRVPFLGAELTLVAAPLRRARREGAALLVPPGAAAGPATAAYLKAEAAARLGPLCAAHAGRLGRPLAGVVLRDTRSRWGSCTATGRLMFNWRLVMAPPAVIDYVAAHEAAHLVEMNHGPAFWALVARLHPDHAAARAWLRRNGVSLQRWSFEG
ncbi:MAG: M48 family metallopeptidase [Alkalilacustris sp.]